MGFLKRLNSKEKKMNSSSEDESEVSFNVSKESEKGGDDLKRISKDPKKTRKRRKWPYNENYMLRSKYEKLAEFCANCQMPFGSCLYVWETADMHAHYCMDKDYQKLPPCPKGIKCNSECREHFVAYNHEELAKHRDNPEPNPTHETVAEIPPADNAFHREQQLQESSPKLPKKKKSLEESSPIAKKNEDENLNELQDNAPLEQFPKKKKMKIVETVEEKSSKPQLAQEIKKHIEIGMRPPMQIEATKTAMGDLNVVVKMSPGVELTTLKMKIPKDMEKGSNIEVNFNGSVKVPPRRRRINKPKMV